MRLLYLCHRIPYPPDKGDKIRSYHQVEYLGRRHEVDLFSLVDDPSDLIHLPGLTKLVRSVTVERLRPRRARLASLSGLLTGEPMSVVYFRNRSLLRAVRRALATGAYDLAMVFSSAMASYLNGWEGPRALDFVDLDSAKWLAYADQLGRSPLGLVYRREGRSLQKLERRLAERAELTLFCAPREEQDLRSFSNPRNALTVPNGTDLEYFTPGTAELPSIDLIFTGAMDYRANVDAVVWFARAVLPLVRARRGPTELCIVGSNPARSVRALGRDPEITVTGRVPDVRPYLRSALVSVAPLRVARGIQNKVLEALACGLPVVASPAALGGLGEARGVLVGPTPEEQADLICRLLSDPPLRRELARAGRTFVAENFRWEAQLERIDRLLESAASSGAVNSAGETIR